MSLVEDVKLSSYWEATQKYPFLSFFLFLLLIFVEKKTLSKNTHYRGGTTKRNPMNKHQNA